MRRNVTEPSWVRASYRSPWLISTMSTIGVELVVEEDLERAVGVGLEVGGEGVGGDGIHAGERTQATERRIPRGLEAPPAPD